MVAFSSLSLTQNPLFSVIIPVYNRVNTVSFSIDSVLAQTYTNFEIILVDDGSTDNTFALLQKYSQLSNVFAYSKLNGGPASARNFGILKASGSYICFLDSDDTWHPSKLTEVSSAITLEPRIIYHKLKICSIYSHDENTDLFFGLFNKYHGQFFPSSNAHQLLLEFGDFMPTSSLTIPSSFIKRHLFKEDRDLIGGAEDYELLLRLTSHGISIQPINSVLGFYYVSNDNLSTTSNIRSRLNVLKKYWPTICNYPAYYYSMCISYVYDFHWSNAFKYYLRFLYLGRRPLSSLKLTCHLFNAFFKSIIRKSLQ